MLVSEWLLKKYTVLNTMEGDAQKDQRAACPELSEPKRETWVACFTGRPLSWPEWERDGTKGLYVRPCMWLNVDHGSREMSLRNGEEHVCSVWRSLAWRRRCLQWAFVECLELVNSWMEGWIQTCRKQQRKRGRVLPTFQFVVPVPSRLLAPVLTFIALHEVLRTSCVTWAILCWFLLLANCNH